MRTPHRTWHLRLWLFIGPIAILIIVASVLRRPVVPVPAQTQEVTNTHGATP